MSRKQDAVDLLQDDHRDVKGLFATFKSLCQRDSAQVEKAAVAGAICMSLSIHAQLEDELFYPAMREATGDDDVLDEAEVEHLGAKDQIARISAMKPGDSLFDARVSVLCAIVERHLKAEEGEIFPVARASSIDLLELGARMQARKSALLAEYKDLAGGVGRFDEAGDPVGRRALVPAGRRVAAGVGVGA